MLRVASILFSLGTQDISADESKQARSDLFVALPKLN